MRGDQSASAKAIDREAFVAWGDDPELRAAAARVGAFLLQLASRDDGGAEGARLVEARRAFEAEFGAEAEWAAPRRVCAYELLVSAASHHVGLVSVPSGLGVERMHVRFDAHLLGRALDVLLKVDPSGFVMMDVPRVPHAPGVLWSPGLGVGIMVAPRATDEAVRAARAALQDDPPGGGENLQSPVYPQASARLAFSQHGASQGAREGVVDRVE